ncbi:LAFA_0F12860g1_1 [Lachancea sp. 'fantastica']|nr:LAFA_0F12860g1_1 [Lachancea sp. 'fantastica']
MCGNLRSLGRINSLVRLKWPCKYDRINTRNLRSFHGLRGFNGRRGGLPPVKIGSTLWRYFNAPGNVMFVTTNVVTLVGIVSYSTLQTMARERALQDYVEQSGLSGEPVVEEARSSHQQESPMASYKAGKIMLPKSSPPQTCHMQHLKMSLFHLLYSYHIYCDVVALEAPSGSIEYNKEVEELRRGQMMEKHKASKTSPQAFYNAWSDEFEHELRNLNRSQQFHMPNWTAYPKSLQILCRTLYEKDMKTMADFKKFYRSIGSGNLRAILRSWLYDNSRFLQIETDFDSEAFYRDLIRSCRSDNSLFKLYSSILLNSSNPRRYAFFQSQGQRPLTVSLETILEVMKGNLLASTDTECYNSSLQLISMIRTNCIATQGAGGKKEVRIILSDDDSSSDIPGKMSSQEKHECLELVSQNSEIIAILGALSKLPG